MHLADFSADIGLIVPEMRLVISGFVAFSATNCGVCVSAGSTRETAIPCGISSARKTSAKPTTANFAGLYAL